MIHTKQIILTALFVLTATFSYAQKTQKDSIYVEIKDKAEVKMSIYEYSYLKASLESDLKQLKEILKVDKDIPETSPYTIIYKPKEKLTIKTSESTETVVWENGKFKDNTFNNTCEVFSDKYHLIIEYNEIEILTSEDLRTKLNEVVDQTMENQSSISTLFNYSFDKENVLKSDSNSITRTGLATIHLQAGVGANLIKNEPVIDLTGMIGVSIPNKGILKNQYYLSYNMLYDFIDSSSVNINGFLSLGYRHNFTDKKDEDNWLGLEFGYLVSQNGDLFDDNTFRLGFSWEAAHMITISPQLYISSEQTYPGLRIGFGF